jgi:hypothetical protein
MGRDRVIVYRIRLWLLCGILLAGCAPATSTPLPGLTASADNPPAASLSALPPGLETLSHLAAADLPVRDRVDLAARFRGIRVDFATPVPPEWRIGAQQTFWVQEASGDGRAQVSAQLVALADHVAMWVEEGVPVDANALQKSADFFEAHTYPTDRAAFGSEPTPGIDGDVHIHVLDTRAIGAGVAGYFYSPSQFPLEIVPYSNEKELIYTSPGQTPGTAAYDSMLSHEFQHMIHWNMDSNEDSWVNDGLSEVATTLNGFGISQFASSYLAQTDTQLNAWASLSNTSPHYGGAYLFWLYFTQRYGADALRRLVAHPQNGLEGLDATLAEIGAGQNADALFADWAVAITLRDPALAPGIYGYTALSGLPAPTLVADIHSTALPYSLDGSVQQYGLDIFRLAGESPIYIRFSGQPLVSILPTLTAHTDGDPATPDTHVWWSNSGDNSDTTLTRQVDLSKVTSARLTYSLWYSLENGWDYGYVAVSADGGKRWQALAGQVTAEFDPHGNAYGTAYSGESRLLNGANDSGWVQEEVDLSAYAGQVILLRFEMITDDALSMPGMALDNVCIKEIGWCDDAEHGAADWIARGFVLSDNVLPQTYLVQVVKVDGEGKVRVIQMALDHANRGEISLTPGATAFLIVSGTTRYTTLPALYRVEIAP